MSARSKIQPKSYYAVDEYIPNGKRNTIDEVVVFSNQAHVKRKAKAKTTEGMNRLRFELNAFSVDGDSVQSNVFGEGEVLSVQYREIPTKEAPQKQVRDLEKKLKSLERKKQIITEKKEVLGKQGKFLDSFIDFARVEIPRELKTSIPATTKLEKTLEFLDSSYGNLSEKNKELDFKQEDLEVDIELVKRELKSLNRAGDGTSKVVEILFHAYQDQEISITTSYITYYASWEPVYKVDIPLDLSGVTLTMFSLITQQTGEDWERVRLSVSNVVPVRGTSLPGAEPWYLELPRYAEYEDMADMAAVPMAAASARVSKKSAPPPPEPEAASMEPDEDTEAGFAAAAKTELPTAFEYQLPQTLTINSSDQETILPLFARPLEGEFFHYAVPRLQPMVFLVCKAAPDKEMLAGALNVYFGGRFVGCTILDEKKPGEDFLLNLGVERGVTVNRDLTRDKVKETFLGKFERHTVSRKLAYKTVVENLKEEPVEVMLLDSLPVSTTDKIEVKSLEAKPKPTARDYQDREGVLMWKLKIEGKQTAEVRTGALIQYPKETPPVGL